MTPIEYYRPCEGQSTLPWLWIGTWSLGGEGFGPHDGREALATLNRAVEQGIRHFDSAGFYAHGRSEQLLAKIIRHQRQHYYISSKGGLIWQNRQVKHKADSQALRIALEQSLERLQTDYLDLYQLHWPDPNTPIQDSIEALQQLQQQKLIRHWGVGNLTAAEVLQYCSPQQNIPHQVHFNPLHRSDDILQVGAQNQRCFNCVISPLEQGLLSTGTSALGSQALGKKDIRQRNPYFRSKSIQIWRNALINDDNPIPQVSLMLLWILTFKNVHAIIAGCRTQKQLQALLVHDQWRKQLGWEITKPTDWYQYRKQLQRQTLPSLWRHLQSPPEING